MITNLSHAGPAVEIMKDTDESADRYFNPGSTISLKCAVKREVVWDNKWDVDWTKDGELLDIFKRKSIR